MKTKEYRLDNGLKLITREMHHAPLAAFFVFYRVGARNEVPGITGISHWVEHMMFKGTPRFGKGELDRQISKHGGVWNGFTTEDCTAYFEVLPAEHLELALDIEADRMANCLVDPGEVHSERTVIISEREGAENSPEFWLEEAVNRIAYLVHPYGQGVIGAKSDLESIAREDLFRHYKTFYIPNNAVCVVCGAFDSDEVFDKVKKHFGNIPPGQEPSRVRSVEPVQEGERRVVISRPGGAKHIQMAFHVPAAKDQDFYPLVVLNAVLSGGRPIAGWGGGGMGRSSRLYKALVETGLASEANAYCRPAVDPGLMQVTLTIREGVETETAEARVREVLDDLIRNEIPGDELERAQKQIRAQIAYTSESVQQNAMALGMFDMFATWEEQSSGSEKVAQVTAAQVKDVAARYLTRQNSTVGWFIPESRGRSGSGGPAPMGRFFYKRAESANQFPDVLCANSLSRSVSAGSLPGPATVKRKVLSNGMVLLAYKNPAVDFMTASALVDAGSYAAPGGKEGLPRFANLCLIRGTQNKTASEINRLTDSFGMRLQASSGVDTAAVSVTALSEDHDKALELLAEILRSPSFETDEVERLKGQTLTAISQAETNTASVAEKHLNRLVYPAGHPYGNHALGSQKDVASFAPADLKEFHASFYAPGRSILAVVSPREPEAVFDSLERAFGSWSSSDTREIHRRTERVGRPQGRNRETVFLPGKTQCDIAIGVPALKREDPDYLKLLVTNTIAGQFGLGGRIGHNVRDEQGLAYYAFSRLAETKGVGLWSVRAGVNPRSVERAIESILEEIHNLREDLVSEEELANVKGYLVGSLPISVETSRALASSMLSMEYYGLGFDFLEKYAERVNAVTREDVNEMSRKYLSSQDCVLVVAGPEPTR